MTPGLWGSISAVSWGAADFVARFTGRAVGYVGALFGMLLISSVFLSLWLVLSGTPIVWTSSSLVLLVFAGVCILAGTLFLYMSLTWGPVTLAAPITGSYPAIVVVIAVILGHRPSLLQWAGMMMTLGGVVVVTRGGVAGTSSEATRGADDPPAGTATSVVPAAREDTSLRDPRAVRRRTAGVAAAAAVAFALMISATQQVVPIVGSLLTLWFPRVVALSLLVAFLVVGRMLGRPLPAIPGRWWPVLGVQAGLDVGGYLTLYVAATGPNPEIAAMTSSAYYVVTVLLGRAVLKERMNLIQIGGIGLVFTGVLMLSA